VFTSWAIPAPGAGPTLFSIQAEAGQVWGEDSKLYYQPVGFQQPAVTSFEDGAMTAPLPPRLRTLWTPSRVGSHRCTPVDEATDTLRLIMAAYKSVDEGVIVKL